MYVVYCTINPVDMSPVKCIVYEHGNIITQGIPSLFSVSKISFIFLMTPIDSSNDQNICVELFKVTFTH